MNPNWAEENLQTIRTLMERSAVYRRALAPIMLFNGVVGSAGGVCGWLMQIGSAWGFVLFWSGFAMVGLIGSFLLVRRQALKDAEPFWSPPTRRLTQAMLPLFVVGLVLGVGVLVAWPHPTVAAPPTDSIEIEELFWLPAVWVVLYGCAIHSAGFFTPRGLRLFGWLFVASGCGIFLWFCLRDSIELPWWTCHLLMGFFFGVLHLAYGAYLYLTKKGKNAA